MHDQPAWSWIVSCGRAADCGHLRIAKVVSIRYQPGMSAPFDRSELVAELLVHVGRAARSEEGQSDLTAAQWACLRFLARANDSTRTPSGFASFQATTRGTASQIIKSLEKLGLIARHRSDADGRSMRLDLTGAGRALQSRDPLGRLTGVIETLSSAEQAQFLGLLSRIASAVADLRQGTAFGTCRDCQHFTPSLGGGLCACMAEELATDDITQLCGSYRGPAPLERRLP